MKTIELTIGTDTYPMATSLRVAYVLQGMNNHKPYLEIFQEIDKMTLEKQIEFMYAAYQVATPTNAIDKNSFLNMCLDNLTLNDVLMKIREIVSGITGKDIADSDETNAEVASSKN